MISFVSMVRLVHFFKVQQEQDVVFLDTGVGIALIKAMIESVKLPAPEDRPKSLAVFRGWLTLDDLYFESSDDH